MALNYASLFNTPLLPSTIACSQNVQFLCERLFWGLAAETMLSDTTFRVRSDPKPFLAALLD